MSRQFNRGAIKVPFDSLRVPERAFFIRLQITGILYKYWNEQLTIKVLQLDLSRK